MGFSTSQGAKHKNIFSFKNFGENLSKSTFSCTYNGVEKHVTCERFENVASRAKTDVIATVHISDDDVILMMAPECLFVKPQSRTLTAQELFC